MGGCAVGKEVGKEHVQPQTFFYEERDRIATVRLSRPDKLNSLTFEVYREMTDLFASLKQRDDVAAVIVSGEGRAFCSGGDVREIIGPLLEQNVLELSEFTAMTCDLVRNIRELPKPVIAALNGTTAGAGAAIALASDFRIAATTAKIAFLFVRAGLSGADMGCAFLLQRVVGLTKATELLMTGDFISADEALRIGLYNAVTPAESLDAEARRWAARFVAGPQFSIGITKQMINAGLGLTLSQALQWEGQLQTMCMLHPDFREAYEAFAAKRPPQFKQG